MNPLRLMLATLVAAALCVALPRTASADTSVIKRPGAHPRYSFEAEPHLLFGAFDGPLGPRLTEHGGRRFHLAGRLELNHWQGRTRVQLRLEDAAEA